MSSYLNFYLLPKRPYKKDENGKYVKDENHENIVDMDAPEPKPIYLCGYSRSNPIYEAIYEVMNVATAYNGEDSYTELTPDGIDDAIASVDGDIKRAEQRLNTYYRIVREGGTTDDVISEIQSLEEYLKELRENKSNVEMFKYILVDNIYGEYKYSGFEKVLINID